MARDWTSMVRMYREAALHILTGLALFSFSCGKEVTEPKQPDIEVTPTVVTMSVESGGTGIASLTVRNVGEAELDVNQIVADSSWVSVNPAAFKVAAGGSQGVVVAGSAVGLSAGMHSAMLAISSNDPDESSVVVPVSLDVARSQEPDIEVSPGSLSFMVVTGRDSSEVLVVWNFGDAPLNVMSITDDAAWLREEPTSFSVAAGSNGNVVVTADAEGMSEGQYSGTITISSNDPDESTKTVGVTLTVTGGGSTEIEMVRINGGTFQMGSNSDWADSDEQPVHSVTVSAFYISKYEVTQAQYAEFDPSHNSCFDGDDRPVEKVSWYDAARFCNWLSEREGYSKFYNESDWSMNWSANGYRLPTEAEWEYACRAGTTTDFYSGDLTYYGCDPVDPNLDRIGWYYGNSSNRTHDVGGKEANSFELYDMSGNVCEWCNDWYDSNYYDEFPSQDPTGPSMGSGRVIRGGGWNYIARGCRSANRYGIGYAPVFRHDNLGFRLLRKD